MTGIVCGPWSNWGFLTTCRRMRHRRLSDELSAYDARRSWALFALRILRAFIVDHFSIVVAQFERIVTSAHTVADFHSACARGHVRGGRLWLRRCVGFGFWLRLRRRLRLRLRFGLRLGRFLIRIYGRLWFGILNIRRSGLSIRIADDLSAQYLPHGWAFQTFRILRAHVLHPIAIITYAVFLIIDAIPIAGFQRFLFTIDIRSTGFRFLRGYDSGCALIGLFSFFFRWNWG